MLLDELKYRLPHDLRKVGLPVDDVDIYFRPYSKTFYGRYYPVAIGSSVRPRLFIYPFYNKSGDLLPYDTIFKVALHEFGHHKQFSNKKYVRVKGVMHDTEFWKVYNELLKKAEKMGIIRGEILEKIS